MTEAQRPASRKDDALIAAVRKGCQAAEVHLTCSFPDCTCKQIPAAVHAVLSERGLWQPIETHPLKEGFEDCLVWDGKEFWIAHQNIYGDWTAKCAGSSEDDKVFYLASAKEAGLTHWMPLPAQPGERNSTDET